MPSHEFGGDWTSQKLAVLDAYLGAYCKIFQRNPRARHLKTVYADAFAGSGVIKPRARQPDGDDWFAEFTQPQTVGFLKGSAALALKHSFDEYVFIEKSERQIAELNALVTGARNADRIKIRKGDANERLEQLVRSRDWNLWRAVVFLDPYGMQVEWKTIRDLGRTRAVDLWLLFPLGQAVMRLLQRRSNPPVDWQNALDRIFGTHEWYERFYRTEREDDLFGTEVASTRRVADWHAVGQFMIERLRTEFVAVSAPGVLLNSQNVPLYLLCFAAANPRGSRPAMNIAKDLLKKLERNG